MWISELMRASQKTAPAVIPRPAGTMFDTPPLSKLVAHYRNLNFSWRPVSFIDACEHPVDLGEMCVGFSLGQRRSGEAGGGLPLGRSVSIATDGMVKAEQDIEHLPPPKKKQSVLRSNLDKGGTLNTVPAGHGYHSRGRFVRSAHKFAVLHIEVIFHHRAHDTLRSRVQ